MNEGDFFALTVVTTGLLALVFGCWESRRRHWFRRFLASRITGPLETEARMARKAATETDLILKAIRKYERMVAAGVGHPEYVQGYRRAIEDRIAWVERQGFRGNANLLTDILERKYP